MKLQHPIGGIALGILLVSFPALPVLAADLVVELENGTEGGGDVEGAEVTLLLPAIDPHTQQETRRPVRATVGPGGTSATFEELDESLVGKKVNVVVKYEGGTYFFGHGAEIGVEAAGPFKIYEATNDPSAFRVIDHRMGLAVHDAGTLMVQEWLQVVNTTDRAYVGFRGKDGKGDPATLVFHLPSGAQEFKPLAPRTFLPDRVKRAENFIVTDVTLFPGEEVFSYSYKLSLEGASVHFDKTIPLPVHVFSAFLPQGAGVDLTIEGLARSIEKDQEGQRYIIYSGQDLEAGTTLHTTLRITEGEGRSGGTGSAPFEHRHEVPEPRPEVDRIKYRDRFLFFGLILAAALVVLAFLKPNPGAGTPAGEREAIRKVLVEEIARLDAAQENGQISSEYHGRQRESLQKRLLQLRR